MKPVELLKEYLVGKKIKHKNQYNRFVSLEVENVESKHYSRQITPDTKENDWYGESENWEMIRITFVDGSNIEVKPNSELEIEK